MLVVVRLWVHGLPYSVVEGYKYMFMNKISKSQNSLYKFFYKKATRFLQKPVTTEGIQL